MAVSLLLRQETETQRSEVVLGSSFSRQGTVAKEEVREEAWEKPSPASVSPSQLFASCSDAVRQEGTLRPSSLGIQWPSRLAPSPMMSGLSAVRQLFSSLFWEIL